MKTEGNDIKKQLYITEFQVWNCDDDTNIIDEIIIKAINSSEGVYVYRSYGHLLEDNDFIEWLKNQHGLKYYKSVDLVFERDNRNQIIVARNNESIYYFQFDKENKESFLKRFKISIRDIKNRIGKENTDKYLEKSIYVDDPLYDQYDFIFTLGEQVILFTDIHDFTFINTEV